jgi:hypothetical protein
VAAVVVIAEFIEKPHSSQKRALSGTSLPQLVHRIVTTLQQGLNTDTEAMGAVIFLGYGDKDTLLIASCHR